LFSSIVGSPGGWFGGGGGGSVGTAGPGGPGGPGGGGTGRGDGSGIPATSGSANTGGGGGGGYYGAAGGAGGSGIVIVHYPLPIQSGSTFIQTTPTFISASANDTAGTGLTTGGPLGMITVSRTGSTAMALWKNRVPTKTTTRASASINLNFNLNSLNASNTSVSASQNTVAYASVGAGLTDDEVGTYYNLVSKLQYDLGRGLLIEGYPAAAAYSVRQLSKTAQYSMEVRRDWDNASSSFGFTSNGDLDTGSLLAFVTGSAGTGSGFVQTWYDQSGNNRHVTQSITSRQPQIINSGSILTQNSKPTIKHIGTTDLKLSTVLNLGTTHTMLGVVKFDSYGKEFIGALTDQWSYAMYNLGGQVDTEARQAVGRTTETFGLNFALFQYYRNGTTTVSMYKNNNLLGGNSFTLNANTNFEFESLSGEENDSYNFVGNMSEVIIYTTNQSSNRSIIESNINSYFNIY